MTCQVCQQSIDPEQLTKIDYPGFKLSQQHNVQFQHIGFCSSCGVGFALPRCTDAQIASIYESGEYWKSQEPQIFKPQLYPGQWSLTMARWEFLKPFLPKRQLMMADIGAGHGFFGMAAAHCQLLSSYTAIEQDPVYAVSLLKSFSFYFPSLKVQTAAQLDQVKGTFDVIIFSHVLEHVNSPNDMIRNVRNRLCKDGLIYIDVPHQDFLFKQDVFPHVLFFNATSLRQLMVRNGFEVLSVATVGRSRDKSPINVKLQGSLLVFLGKVFYHLRQILPLTVSKYFYDWYFGSNQENSTGTFLRVVAKKIE